MICCCACKTCTHRRLDSSGTIIWSDNVWDKPHSGNFPQCPADVIDMQARGFLYLIARLREGGERVVAQKWTLDGINVWSVLLPGTSAGSVEWLPARIDSDDTRVWICGPLAPGLSPSGDFDNFFCLDSDDGAILWRRGNDASDIEPDGSGGVFYGHFGGTDCEVETGTENGYVVHLDENGDPIRSFGGLGHAYSLLNTGSALWVGSNGFSIPCFCPEGPVTIEGCLARYSLTGTLELFTGGGTWVDSTKDQVSLLGSPDAYVNRLAVSPDGHILCGLYNTLDLCLLLEFRQDTGALVRSFDLSVSDEGDNVFGKIHALACTSSAIGAVTGYTENFLYLFDESASKIATKRHRGYLTGTHYMYSNAARPLLTTEYRAVTATSSAFFAGGTEAGCTPHNDDTDATSSACDAEQLCECGDFNTRGQAVVGCGCEDGVDPTCAPIVYNTFTGCLANMAGTLTFAYVDPSLGTGCNTGCGAGGHQWNATIPSFSAGACGTLAGTATVCYDCVSGWSLKYCITSGGSPFATFRVTITDSFCNPPSFTFTFDGTADYLSEAAEACCAGLTGCGGMNNTGGCPICECSSPPDTAFATATSSCGAVNGATGSGDLTDGDHYTATLSACGLTAILRCISGGWRIEMSPPECFLTSTTGASGQCDPFEWSATFTYLNGGSCTCCSTGGITVTFTE